MKVRLQPASRSDLPIYNPILPVSAITQVMLIANPNKVIFLLLQTYKRDSLFCVYPILRS
jgi:hypothetical protein